MRFHPSVECCSLLSFALGACTDAAPAGRDPSVDANGGAIELGASAGGVAGRGGGVPSGGSAGTIGAPSGGSVGAAGALVSAGGTRAMGSGGGVAMAAGGTGAAGGPSAADAGVPLDDGGVEGDRVCANGAEGEAITLACPAGQIVDSIVFASYGEPAGVCGAYAAGPCAASTSLGVTQQLCVGRDRCTLSASNAAFGDPCNGTPKRLAVEARCTPGTYEPSAPFKGVANSPCGARQALHVSWYYNWTQTENEPCSDGAGGQFVPMIWGHPGNEQSADEIRNSVGSFVARGYEYVLGFNEPDNSTQSDIPVSTAISLWPAFDNAAITVGSPGTAANANPGQAWFTDFMNQLNADAELRADFLAIHWYGWNAGSCDAAASGLEGYIRWVESFPGGRPIWITEWGCLNQSAPDVETVIAFYRGALEVFARHPRVERYAWYPWATNNGLVNGDGSLTVLGQVYADAPAFR